MFENIRLKKSTSFDCRSKKLKLALFCSSFAYVVSSWTKGVAFVADCLSQKRLLLLVGLKSNLVKKGSDTFRPESWLLFGHLFQLMKTRFLHKIIHIILTWPDIFISNFHLFESLFSHIGPTCPFEALLLILLSQLRKLFILDIGHLHIIFDFDSFHLRKSCCSFLSVLYKLGKLCSC
jgi:hypothetical protein